MVPAVRLLYLSGFLFSFATAVQLHLTAATRKSHSPEAILDNVDDLLYFVDVSLGGNNFSVLVDTGSSDLWVAGNVPGTKNLSVLESLGYAIGNPITGYINTARLDFDGFSVEDQVYLLVSVEDAQKTSFPQGVIGLGPSASSFIRGSLGNSNSADPPLDRIFQQNTTTPSYMTLLLSRNPSTEAISYQSSGQLTIGETIPKLEAVLDAPKLPVLVDQPIHQHWATLLDSNGIIGPDGQIISTTTTIPNPSEGSSEQLHVMFDSGFTVPQVPGYIIDAIYGRIPGASFIEDGTKLNTSLSYSNFWRLPCDYEVNVSFIFSGQEYPVAPLDLNRDMNLQDGDGENICMAFYQTGIASSASTLSSVGALDMILGMAFLRNTYALFNFGDFVDGTTSSVGNPYIQLLSLSNKHQIHLDFVNARLGGKDSTGTQAPLLPSPQSHPDGEPASGSNDGTSGGGSVTGDPSNDNSSSPSRPSVFAAWMSILGVLIFGVC
ncbi:hypothetical protein D9758_002635 [Tetrapyrgos nigripes]|uniref:Peptidase A1 domain-containing protein n=1 Tax=Tetrapyrgos nigripes TaxID=182062 RepID=A0A8H5GQB5_9AGAR|nr:hypothetical protein D9758_002635 [Tetrapyrgos nigripes]